MEIKKFYLEGSMKSPGFQMKNFLDYVKNQPKGPELHISVPPKNKKQRKKSTTASQNSTPATKPGTGKVYRKQKISQALREQVWIQRNGKVFQAKCMVTWCKNMVTVFDFQCGHDIPESKGGPTKLENLYPICGKCNLSMSNTYTFQEWCKLYQAVATIESVEPKTPISIPATPKKSGWRRFFCFT